MLRFQLIDGSSAQSKWPICEESAVKDLLSDSANCHVYFKFFSIAHAAYRSQQAFRKDVRAHFMHGEVDER